MRPLPAARAGRRPALGDCGCRPTRICAFDTNDYSLDPAWSAGASRCASSQREITAVALDTGELACRHERSFAKHRTITALEHARALRERRGDRGDEVVVEQRPLAATTPLIA